MSKAATQPRTLFVVGPIGEKDSDIRRDADTLRNEIILPAAEEAFGEGGFILERADDIGQPGRISLQVLEKLVVSDIAIVDLTGLNANVMYELGVRQARLKPYILLRPAEQALPFDISDIRAIDFDFTLPGGKRAIKSLAEMLKNADKSVTATDMLLFQPNGGIDQGTSMEPWQQRIQVQILDQLSAIRETQDSLLFGVGHLMQQEDRQRSDLAEHRQQEMVLKFMEVMASTNPDAMVGLVKQFADAKNGEGIATNTPDPIVTGLSRSQRRAAARKAPKK